MGCGVTLVGARDAAGRYDGLGMLPLPLQAVGAPDALTVLTWNAGEFSRVGEKSKRKKTR